LCLQAFVESVFANAYSGACVSGATQEAAMREGSLAIVAM